MRHALTLCVLVCAATASAQTTIFVDADAPSGGDGFAWNSAFTDLQDALTLARGKGGVISIWVAEGTYTPDQGTGDRDAAFALVSGVSVLGGFAGGEDDPADADPEANPTILSGDLNGDDTGAFGNILDNSRHIVVADGLPEETVLDGFVIRGGHADFPPDLILGGGGLFASESVLRVRRCRFESNVADDQIGDNGIGGFGGGMFSRGGEVVVENCRFEGNRANSGGGMAIRAIDELPQEVTVIDTEFAGNLSEGSGGAFRSSMSPFESVPRFLVLKDCTFEGNESGTPGGAISSINDWDLEIDGCSFTGNMGGLWGGALWHSQSGGPDQNPARINRCLFQDNQSNLGGGAIFIEASHVRLSNSRLIGNVSEEGDGGAVRAGPLVGLAGGSDPLEVTNCEFVGNFAPFGGAIITANLPFLRVHNSTFYRNSTDNFSGGITVDADGPSEIANCIFWQNDTAGVMTEFAQVSNFQNATPLAFDSNLVQGLTGLLGGEGNIDADPRFADPVGPDGEPGTGDEHLALAFSSPARDAGDASLLPADLLDLDGDGDTGEAVPLDLADAARVVGANVDMGALEIPSPCLADVNVDGRLSIVDFVAFQSLFAQGDAAADVSMDGTLNAIDFVIFQKLFQQGCLE